ncbi:MAG: stage II sporulation protein M [Vicinamibacterales bacterium]
MTALQFEDTYGDEWAELERLLALLPSSDVEWRRMRKVVGADPVSTARIAELYRRACGQLALARARAYPAHLVDRLDALTADAHQRIDRHSDVGWTRVWTLVRDGIPTAVRAHRVYVAVAAAAFVVPTVVMALLVVWRPELILSMVSADTAAGFEAMYSPTADSIGRLRTAETDWTMFGFYIRNNIGVAFQCFAGGLFAGVGSLSSLRSMVPSAARWPAIVIDRGLSSTFFSFVATHSAFELTAIVLSAAGLRMGYSVVAPGRMRRLDALVLATRESVVVLYGATALLVIAAAFEAFWSSARWIPLPLKYTVAAICWAAAVWSLLQQGRRAH